MSAAVKVKECRFCKSPMRADARVCAACGRENDGAGTGILALLLVSPFLLCFGVLLFLIIGGLFN